MENNKPRVSVRLSPYQLQVLEELKAALNCNISLIIRAMIGSFITQNEEILNSIIDGSREFNKDWLKEE